MCLYCAPSVSAFALNEVSVALAAGSFPLPTLILTLLKSLFLFFYFFDVILKQKGEKFNCSSMGVFH